MAVSPDERRLSKAACSAFTKSHEAISAVNRGFHVHGFMPHSQAGKAGDPGSGPQRIPPAPPFCKGGNAQTNRRGTPPFVKGGWGGFFNANPDDAHHAPSAIFFNPETPAGRAPACGSRAVWRGATRPGGPGTARSGAWRSRPMGEGYRRRHARHSQNLTRQFQRSIEDSDEGGRPRFPRGESRAATSRIPSRPCAGEHPEGHKGLGVREMGMTLALRGISLEITAVGLTCRCLRAGSISAPSGQA